MSLLERWMEDTVVVSQKDGFPSFPSLVVHDARAFVSSSGAVESARRKKRATQKRVDGVTEKWMAFSNSHMISSLSRRLPSRPGVEASDIAAKSPGDSVKTYPSLKDGR